jgi:hypothetical protein
MGVRAVLAPVVRLVLARPGLQQGWLPVRMRMLLVRVGRGDGLLLRRLATGDVILVIHIFLSSRIHGWVLLVISQRCLGKCG